jgi:hypothetical protein
LNLAGLQGLTWILLGIACIRTRTSWRDAGVSVKRTGWRERVERWQKGGLRGRQSWRKRMLELNPVAWLEGRDRLQARMLWAVCLLSAIFWAAKHLHAPQAWPDNEMLFIWPSMTHYSFCVWLAIQAPRRLADDKQSGALELLLCTPVKKGEILRGIMRVLRQRFGRALLALLVVDAFVVYAYFSARNWLQFFGPHGFFQFGLCGLAVAVFQAYSLARVGLYQGLRQGNSLRATFFLLAKLVILPWVTFVFLLFSFEFLRRQFGLPWTLSETFGLLLWTGVHLLICTVFLLHAKWQLAWNFRALAAQTTSVRWLERAGRFFRWSTEPGGPYGSPGGAPAAAGPPAGTQTPPPA